uniref:KH type-2 domain-containing protein n=1 Tax=Propithecus coquereli TaxID=379532 RepID=A0A2K6GMC7_PROCO
MAVQISNKRKAVADGIFQAELNEFLTQELAEDGYSGVEIRVTPTRTKIIILATRTQNVLDEKGRRIRELTTVVQKRFGFPEGNLRGCGTHQCCSPNTSHFPSFQAHSAIALPSPLTPCGCVTRSSQ